MSKSVSVIIKGISPLLMNRYPLDPIENPPLAKRPKEEQAELTAYRIPGTDELYVPAVAIQRALVNGGAYSKGKGRASLQKQVAACVLVTPEYCNLNTKKFAIDARPVVVPATKGRIVRYRARLDNWETTFSIEYDENLLKEKEVREIVDNTGSRVGLLDFRPQNKGPFGRFMVTKWQTR